MGSGGGLGREFIWFGCRDIRLSDVDGGRSIRLAINKYSLTVGSFL